jgi:hypothetical protein
MVEHRDPDHAHDDAPVHRRTVLESGGSGGAGIAIAIVLLLVLAVAFFLLFGDAFTGDDTAPATETPALMTPEAGTADGNVDTGEPADPAAPADGAETVE